MSNTPDPEDMIWVADKIQPLGPDFNDSGAIFPAPPAPENFSIRAGGAPDQEDSRSVSKRITDRLHLSKTRFWANDNIASYIEDGEKQELIEEVSTKFQQVLRSLIIDVDTDPNSYGTAKRLAKMYVNELMSGRYDQAPPVTAFPNDDVDTRYSGMITVRSEIVSMCSHHHQPVKGVCYIGILPSVKVIGLSKYTRIAQWCARRGTLQEELTKQIADEIEKHTGTRDLAVYVHAEHGCCVNRGIMATSSLTQTTELRGQFYNPSVKSEFLTYLQIQQAHSSKTVF